MQHHADPIDKTAIWSTRPLMDHIDRLIESHGTGDRLRAPLLALVRDILAEGRAQVRRRFEEGGTGEECVRLNALLIDQILKALATVAGRIFPAANPTRGEHVAIIATGGYGRGELAPFSDVDLLFVLPYKRTPHVEQVVEYLLYLLWDLGLKVGHAVRSVEECLRQAKADQTIRTSLLELRFLSGDRKLFTELRRRFAKEVVTGSGTAFIEAKLAERDERHRRLGDSRYVLEPNVKEGKGGLRDLQTLFWIAKYVHQVEDVRDLVAKGVLLREEAARFAKAQEFLWTVRCHLHYLAGRAEDRLTFDVQPEISQRLGYTDHAGSTGVERFMKHYFLVAKDVGNLTRIFCANLEAESRRAPRFSFLRSTFFRKEVDGFALDGGRLNVGDKRHFLERPLDLIRLFRIGQENGLDIHPNALRAVTRALGAIGPELREDPEANRLFLEILTSDKDPEGTLRRMSEAGVLGRFIPDFGRVLAQMQFDMYHAYTVDEHTLFAIGILHRMETGQLRDDLPLATEVIGKLSSRRALYCAMLLHDIAKGRGGDHSVLGAEVAERLCPRLGLSAEETETVSWLVRWHLVMSNTAFRRDLEDEKTIRDFAEIVQSPERLRLLFVLTTADIRAVGPGRWNAWKATLIGELYARTEDLLSGSGPGERREHRIQVAHAALRDLLPDWSQEDFDAHVGRGYPAYWLGFDAPTHAHQARLIRKAEQENAPLTIDTRIDRARAVTEVTIYTPDHPGLFSRLAGALSVSGATIVDAKIFTMANGMALDVFSVQDATGGPFDSEDKLARLSQIVARTLSGELRLPQELAKRRRALRNRVRTLHISPRVLIDNKASTTHTVIEVNGRDRPGFLYDVTHALTHLSLQISSAKVSTFGEKAVDVFYVKDVFGMKVEHESKLNQIREKLREALVDEADSADAPGRFTAADRRRNRKGAKPPAPPEGAPDVAAG